MFHYFNYYLAVVFFLGGFLVEAQEGEGPKHGISTYEEALKYNKDFKKFDHVNEKAPKGGTFTMGVLGTFDTFNSFVIKGQPAAGITYLYPSLLFVTLTSPAYDEANSAYCYAAESIELAKDRSWIIFTMREGLTFHDDSPLTVDDVIYSFNVLKEKGLPFFKAYYKDVLKVEKLDQRRIKFLLASNSNKELPLIIGQFPILSKKFYSKHSFEKADLTPPLGNGPYKIASFKPGHAVTYERVKGWWGEKLPLNKGRYNFDKISYQYYRDDTVMFESFKRGDYDLRVETTAKRWAQEYNFPAIKQGKLIQEQVSDSNPKPMIGLVFNLRRSLFKDIKVRQALTYLLDFEWLNENFFYNTYSRCKSYFQGSELASEGLPSAVELEILQSYKGRVPERVFAHQYLPPKTDGSGNIRQNLRLAVALLEEAGWSIKQGVLTHQKTNQPFSFDILIADPKIEKILQSFVKNLKRVGIEAKIRIVDTAQYSSRVDAFDYDMIYAMYSQSISPGNEQREFWGSSRADMPGSRNYIGIKDPIIDEIVEKLIAAQSRQDLIHYCRVLDRLLLWGYYMIPGWGSGYTRLAYWKKLKHPSIIPPYGIDIYAWWSADAER